MNSNNKNNKFGGTEFQIIAQKIIKDLITNQKGISTLEEIYPNLKLEITAKQIQEMIDIFSIINYEKISKAFVFFHLLISSYQNLSIPKPKSKNFEIYENCTVFDGGASNSLFEGIGASEKINSEQKLALRVLFILGVSLFDLLHLTVEDLESLFQSGLIQKKSRFCSLSSSGKLFLQRSLNEFDNLKIGKGKKDFVFTSKKTIFKTTAAKFERELNSVLEILNNPEFAVEFRDLQAHLFPSFWQEGTDFYLLEEIIGKKNLSLVESYRSRKSNLQFIKKLRKKGRLFFKPEHLKDFYNRNKRRQD